MRTRSLPIFALLAACASEVPAQRKAETAAVVSAPVATPGRPLPKRPSQVVRIGPQATWTKVQAGEALIICAYEKPGKCDDVALQGSISQDDLLGRINDVPKDRELIFYCACPNEKSAAIRAIRYARHGWWNVKVLDGGVNGWEDAGLPRPETAP